MFVFHFVCLFVVVLWVFVIVFVLPAMMQGSFTAQPSCGQAARSLLKIPGSSGQVRKEQLRGRSRCLLRAQAVTLCGVV